jgi:hypothetical protein
MYSRTNVSSILYDASLSFSGVVGCNTCSPSTNSTTITDPTGSVGRYNAYEYSGSMMTDKVCLMFDPSSASCADQFGFFTWYDWNTDAGSDRDYLGLAPIGKLNGPSIV